MYVAYVGYVAYVLSHSARNNANLHKYYTFLNS